MAPIADIVKTLVVYFKPKKEEHCVYDSYLSSLHYKLAFGVLITCVALSGMTTWYSPLKCTISDNPAVPQNYVDEICYANATFIIETKQLSNVGSQKDEHIFKLTYYQWATLALLLQATCFQLPRVLWKALEGKRAETVIKELRASAFDEPDQREAKMRKMIKFIFDRTQLENNSMYFMCFAFCQSLYMINSIGQILFLQFFFRGKFFNLLSRWLSDPRGIVDVFPITAHCIFSTAGPGGSAQVENVLCVLALNVLLEKIYVVLWVMLSITTITAAFQVLHVLMFMMDDNYDVPNLPQVQGLSNVSDYNENSIKLLLSFVQRSLEPLTFSYFWNQLSAGRV